MSKRNATRTFSIKGEGGIPVRVDIPARMHLELPEESMTSEQAAIVGRMFDAGSPKALGRDDWEAVRHLRATVKGAPDAPALIVRFDWTWVRIDERALDYEEMIAIETRR